jgi:hypothetical protein
MVVVIMEQKIMLAIIIISLAMLGAAAAATTTTSYNVIQQTLAAKSVNFCYNQSSTFNGTITRCYDNNGACKKAQSSDTLADSDCSKNS